MYEFRKSISNYSVVVLDRVLWTGGQIWSLRINSECLGRVQVDQWQDMNMEFSSSRWLWKASKVFPGWFKTEHIIHDLEKYYISSDHDKPFGDGETAVSFGEIHEDPSFCQARRDFDWFLHFHLHRFLLPNHLFRVNQCCKREEKDEGLDDDDGSSRFSILVSQRQDKQLNGVPWESGHFGLCLLEPIDV